MKRFGPLLIKAYILAVLAFVCVSHWAADPNSVTTNETTQVKVVTKDGAASVTTTVEKRVPNLTFGLDKVPGMETKMAGFPLWQYVASLIYIILAILGATIVDWLATGQLRKVVQKTASELDDKLLEYAHGPIKVIAIVIALQIGLEMFDWPIWVEDWAGKVFIVLLAMSITFMLVRMVDLLIMHWKLKAQARTDKSFNDQLFPIISNSIKAFVVVVAALLTSHNLGLNITSLIASLSVVGLAVGLAAQDTAANLFGAVAVFVDKPFQIGDRIKLNDIDGTVETMGLRSTRIRNLDGFLVTVPNKTMGNSTIINITRRPTIKTVMNIGLTYETTSEKLKRAVTILKEVYGSHPKTFDLVVGFNNFGDSALNIQVVHWWADTDGKAHNTGMEELNLSLKEKFEAEGIHFAFPSRTVYLKQDSDLRIDLPSKDAKAL